MKLLIAAMCLLCVSGCSDSTPPKADSAAPTASAEIVAAITAAATAPRHHYAIEEDGEYGYEPGISEDDKKAGRALTAMVMVRYAGEKDGTIAVQIVDGQNKGVFSCKAPCEFVKTRTYFAGELLKTETTRNTQNSVLWAVMQDAQNGQLTPYASRGNKRPTL